MSDWFNSERNPSSNIRKLLQERIDKVNLRAELTADEIKRLNKLQAIANKLKRGKNELFIPLTNL